MNKNVTTSIAEKLLRYMGGRNLPELTELFDETVDWDIPGNTEEIPWLGVRSKKDEVKIFFQQLWDNTEPVAAEIHKIMCEENSAVIIGEFATRMKKTGRVVNSFFCIDFLVEDSLIKRYRLFENSFAVSEAMRV